MDCITIRVLSTESLHEEAQLLGESTGKSVNFMNMLARFNSAGGEVDVASLANTITQEDDTNNDNFYDNSSSFAINNILPRFLVVPIVAEAPIVSFSNDIIPLLSRLTILMK